MRPINILSLALLSAAAMMNPGVATADDGGVKAGILSCELTGTTNVVVYTDETFQCSFNPNSGSNEFYSGEIKRIGVDLEFKTNQQLIWVVLAPSTDVGPGALAGDYAGASASASVGVGAGAKVLIGGSDKSITLQPVSIAGSTGAGAAAGIESFTLTSK
jgi:hypothetical protein